MIRLNARVFSGILLIAISLGACNFPTSPTASPTGPNVAHTAAAKTIAAQLTQIMFTATRTSSPGSANLPQGTQPAIPTGPLTTGTPGPTLSPTPLNTSTPTVTEAPTVTTVGSDPREKLGKPTWIDYFNNGDNWPLFDDEHVTMNVSNGQLQMTALNADKWNSWMMTATSLANFYLEGTATPGPCSGLDHYGLMVRAPDENQGYLYAFSCDGQYSLTKWNGKFSVKLVDWTKSDFIQAGPGKTNRLGVMAQGGKLSLYANGNLLTEVVDNSYLMGGFGVLVGAAETPGFTVAYDQMQYWILP
jgi:hypothetical protein